MANNQYVNRVDYGDDTLIDISDTTAEASDVLSGQVFYTKSGAPATGTLSEMTGATSSADGSSGLVPEPQAGDQDKFLRGDGTWVLGGKPMVILSYGSSNWSDFINAYNDNIIVYCRASSNANPASGSQTRMAFMAYVNDGANPTQVEFQYYRSVSSHSSTQICDQVFIYTLNKTSGWSVTTREAGVKQFSDGTNITTSYSNNIVTINAPSNVSAFTNDAGYLTSHQDISGKVDKVSGKDLSTNDFTNDYKAILDNIATTTETQAIIDEYEVSV